MKHSIYLAIIALALLGSCKKDSNNGYGGTSAQSSMKYSLKATNPSYAVSRSTGAGNIQWTSGTANPGVVRFSAVKDNIPVSYTGVNDQQVDLMSDNMVSFGTITLTPGIYSQVVVKYDLDKNGTDPALVLNGMFTSGPLTYAVIFEVDQPVELTTTENNVTVTQDSTFVATTDIDLQGVNAGITAAMLMNAQLTHGIDGSSGTIVISATSNPTLFNTLLASLGATQYACTIANGK